MQRLKKIFFALTRRERVVFVVALAVAVVSFVVTMSIVIAEVTTTVPAAGGEYAEGMVGQPEYVNPVTATSETDLSLVKLIYSNIYDIADSVTESPDGRTWTVRLKDNLTWQDGQKLTSDDVIFTVQSIQNPDAQSPLYASWQGVTASRVSELEVQFTLTSPYAFFSDNLQNLYILPKHLFADVPPGNWRLSEYSLKPIGSGPYEFTSYDQQSDGVITAYHLQAWNNYWNAKPLISNLDLDFFANTDDLIKSFNDGTIDGMGGLTTDDLANIDHPYDLFDWRTPTYYAVFFNESQNIALQDANVREALSEAVDRDALVSQVLNGEGKPEYGPIPEDAPYFTPTVTTTSLDDASATLTADGWTFPVFSATSTATSTTTNAVPDGTFRAKTIAGTSVPLVVNLTVPDIDFLVQTADILQNTWEGIGVQVNVATDTPENIASNEIQNRNYESLLFGNVLGPSSDLYAFWDSSQRFYPGLNLAIYSNPQVDRLVETAREELGDATRTAEFAAAEQDIVANNPAIFLYSPDYLYVTNKNVQGITPDFIPDPSDRFREMTTWYLDTARVLK
ncbi:MAG TPA: ABC transporter substrate-binding protein [Candidatus Paceibacterota bacterium]|jgi:peptide/nickel transport system substrate-binding protein|nr:ABC transporter substrate-binding protein [Candidatus Paceibacterota bacterium]